MAGISPLHTKQPEKQQSDRGGYKVKLLFNDQAQLLRVDGPSNLTTTQIIEHLAVAVQFVAQEASRMFDLGAAK